MQMCNDLPVQISYRSLNETQHILQVSFALLLDIQ